VKPVHVTDSVQRYMEDLLAPRSEVLARLEREAEAEGLPIVGPHEGMLLYMLVRLSGARRLLELGAATGYSGLWLLRGAPDGHLTTFELDPARAARARENIAAAGCAERADVRQEDAVAGVEALDGEYDLCFIDLLNSFGSEEVTERVFTACLHRLTPGGLLVADNALRQGEVVHPGSQQARNVARYNELVARTARLESVIIPLRDGVSVARLAR
jgi:predicted O-methyltransferase YrrM